MEKLALLLLFPLLWPFVAKALWKHEITLMELTVNLLAGAVIVVGGWYAGKYAQTHDVEIINGRLVSKTRDKVSCEHSYKCACYQSCTGSGDKRSCTESCSTCYDHSYDVDWNLRTSVGDIEVDRVDRRGLTEPPRWTKAVVGDPVAKSSAYVNYVKAAPDSLFNALRDRQALERFAAKVPAYPDNIYDLHYVNRVLAVGVNVPDAAAWNQDLALRLRDLGAAKQVNAIVVFTNETDPEFATALRASWLGGKKNDVVVVLGAPEYPKLAWSRVVSWTDAELFKVQLRDELMSGGDVDKDKVLGVIEKNINAGFVRKQMSDFEYLSNEIEPPTWLIALLFLLSGATSVGTSVYLARNMERSRFTTASL